MLHTSYRTLAFAVFVAGFLSPTGATGSIETLPGHYSFDYATGIDEPTSITFGPYGTLYVATFSGEILALRDVDGNRFADDTSVFANGLTTPLGLVWHVDRLYVSSRGIVTTHRDLNGDYMADLSETVITGLPFGQHTNAGLAFGPNDLLYVVVGSVTNSGSQPPLSANILRYLADGTFIDVYATGLRNAFDLAFSSLGFLYAPDNSPGADSTSICFEAPDELNLIREGMDYGFPNCLGIGDCADVSLFCSPPPCGPGDCEFNQGCEPGSSAPAVLFDPHSAPTGITFTQVFGDFPPNDLMVALFGQNVRVPGCNTEFGSKVVHVNLSALGLPLADSEATDFAWGFERPIDVRVGPDAALYVADFATGIIHRIIKTIPGSVPGETAGVQPLLLAFPNPVRSRARISWTTADLVSVRVVDVAGREVRRLEIHPGAGSVDWDLRDAQGRRVRSGLYFLRARSETADASSKLLVLD